MPEERPQYIFHREGIFPTQDITLWMSVEAQILRSKSDQNFLISLVSIFATVVSFAFSFASNYLHWERVATVTTILFFMFLFFSFYTFFKSYINYVHSEEHRKNCASVNSCCERFRAFFKQKWLMCCLEEISEAEQAFVQLEEMNEQENMTSVFERETLPEHRDEEMEEEEILAVVSMVEAEVSEEAAGQRAKARINPEIILNPSPDSVLFTRRPEARSSFLQSLELYPPSGGLSSGGRNSYPLYQGGQSEISTISCPIIASSSSTNGETSISFIYQPRGSSNPEVNPSTAGVRDIEKHPSGHI